MTPEQVHNLVIKKLWGRNLKTYGRFKASLIKFLRILYLSLREFSEENLTLRAESLTYTTLLSVVPLLAFAFSVVKAFGGYRLMEPVLGQLLAPLGAQGEEATKRIIQFVGRMNVGVLGSVGLVTLISTLVSGVSKIEDVLNGIWKVKRARTTIRKVTDYISVLILGPILIFTAFAITASVMNSSVAQTILDIHPLGSVIYAAGKIIPFVIVAIAFIFIFVFIPNMKINTASAIIGGLFTGIVWQITGWAFAAFVASSTQYTAIYSSFAIVILFMLWVYLSWIIVFIGAEIAFHHQFFRANADINECVALSIRSKERMAILIMFMVSYNFYRNKPPWNLYTFIDKLGLSVEHIQNTLMLLKNKNLLIESGESREEPLSYLPARDIGTIAVSDIIQAVRTAEDDTYVAGGWPPIAVPEVDQIMETLDRNIVGTFKEKNIRDMVFSLEVKNLEMVYR